MHPEKISPSLLFALQDYQNEGPQGLARYASVLGFPQAIPRPRTIPAQLPTPGVPLAPRVMTLGPKASRAVVFIKLAAPNAQLRPESRDGVVINRGAGRVRTAYLSLDRLPALSDDPAVEKIVPARYLRPLMDVAAGRVQLPAFRSNHGLTGKGVIIGVIDSGIDPTHAAFQGRILRIWDQTLSGPGVAEGGYGAEFTSGMLEVSRDLHGHGTHVAGIAAGNDPVYPGVAPEAELIIVKTDFQDAHIADGVEYVFRVAGEMGRPAVVNLSLGGHADAHDGSDPLSAIIDAESGPGRIVCCAAGNEGNDDIHARVGISQNWGAVRFRVPSNTVGIAALNGWYGGSAQLEIAIRSPGGFVTNPQGLITSGPFERYYALPDATVRIATPGPDPSNGDVNFLVQILGTTVLPAVTEGVWQLRARAVSPTSGNVTIDVWSLDAPLNPGLPLPPQVFFTGTGVVDAFKIGAPGSAASAVTVAAFTTRVQWADVDGNPRAIGLALDTIADFSSEGPTRKGGLKPEVAAPGAMIVSALSSDAAASRSSMIDAQHMAEAGTSMASPFIAGLVALLLQRNPSLTPDAVKALLRANSSIPGRPPGTFDVKWGYGLINAAGL